MGMSTLDKALLYTRTVARMKPSMVVARLRRPKSVSEAPSDVSLFPLGIACGALDASYAYASRFDLDALVHDEFLLINETHKVDLTRWAVSEASHLWNFNLHYFEYCVPLAARYAAGGSREDLDLFKRLALTWMAACKYPRGDAWHPYTISLRLVNWLICIDLFGEALTCDKVFMGALARSMYRQYRHLLANQERHLLANHYLENLKTLVVCALLFGEDDVLARVERDYLTQLDEQVLPDGVHYERSMMYHKLILEGLLRVELAYRSVGKAAPTKVASKARQMLDAMASIERGMGKTPFFNDSADGVAKECGPLARACRDVYGYEPDDAKTAFPDSGFYKLYDGDAALVFFAGEPGPSYMLGHAHCDLLSFELSMDGKPVIVNSGTYAYQSKLRSRFRSTIAHNAPQVEGDEQMECWAEHRVARRARNIKVIEFSENRIRASFTSCRGMHYERSFDLEGCVLKVKDKANSKDGSPVPVTTRIHIAPHIDNVCIKPVGAASKDKSQYDYSPQFGVLEQSGLVTVANLSSVSYELRFGDVR